VSAAGITAAIMNAQFDGGQKVKFAIPKNGCL
jgi:hypothetical protein